MALVGGALVLVVFGVVIGLNAGRFTEPDQTVIPPGSRIPVPAMPEPASPDAARGRRRARQADPARDAGRHAPGGARRAWLRQRYSEAIAAYQAVLKRDPRNVDAMTHLGLIVAIGGHADAALETFDKALAIDPNYAPAYLYRGQVLYEVKRDYPGAIGPGSASSPWSRRGRSPARDGPGEGRARQVRVPLTRSRAFIPDPFRPALFRRRPV